MLFLVLGASWLGLLGRWHWILDLLSHFRWQSFAAAFVALLWLLWQRRPVILVTLAALTLLLNGSLIYLTRGKADFARTEGRRLRVVSLNVLASNPDKNAVLEYVKSADADVLFLMEVDASWAATVDGLKGSYPHHIMELDAGAFGVALLSRVPLTESRLFHPEDSGTPSIQAKLMHEGRELMLVGTHPVPPMGASWAHSRDNQMEAVGRLVRLANVPVLVMGDLNATPWSYGMRKLKEGNSLDFRCPQGAWRPTWRARSLFAIPIDHALCTPPLNIARRDIGPDVGSDHRPQLLEIGWATTASQP